MYWAVGGLPAWGRAAWEVVLPALPQAAASDLVALRGEGTPRIPGVAIDEEIALEHGVVHRQGQPEVRYEADAAMPFGSTLGDRVDVSYGKWTST
jgi:hypothetical protein